MNNTNHENSSHVFLVQSLDLLLVTDGSPSPSSISPYPSKNPRPPHFIFLMIHRDMHPIHHVTKSSSSTAMHLKTFFLLILSFSSFTSCMSSAILPNHHDDPQCLCHLDLIPCSGEDRLGFLTSDLVGCSSEDRPWSLSFVLITCFGEDCIWSLALTSFGPLLLYSMFWVKLDYWHFVDRVDRFVEALTFHSCFLSLALFSSGDHTRSLAHSCFPFPVSCFMFMFSGGDHTRPLAPISCSCFPVGTVHGQSL